MSVLQSSGQHTVEVEALDGPDRRRRGPDEGSAPALTLLHHPDIRRVGERAFLRRLAGGGPVRLSRLEPGFHPPFQPAAARRLDDPYVSRTPIHIEPGPAPGGLRLVVDPVRPQLRVDGRPVTDARELSPEEVRRGAVLEIAGRVVLLLHLASPGAEPPPSFDLVGESSGLLRVRREIAQVADLDVPVLMRGETGTGKELVARALHRASRRRDRDFLTLNMGAVPPTIAASELFGTREGAFTGAGKGRMGHFQRAHRGTLFLDEIGEAPPEVQVLLLRALESGEVQRVGGQEPEQVDVRLLAATDMNLEQAIDEGRFRAPLLHRLSGYEIAIPALRHRRDDFGRLLYHFLRAELERIGEEKVLRFGDPTALPWMQASIVARLARHHWPGNVRQLRNVARQLVIRSRGSRTVQVPSQVERLLREVESEDARRDAHSLPAPSVPRQGAVPHREWDPAETLPGPVTSPFAPKSMPESAPSPHPAPTAAAPPVSAPPTSNPPASEPDNSAPAYRKPSDVSEGELLAALRKNRWEIKPTAEDLGLARPSLYMLIDRTPSVRKVAELTEEEIRAAHTTAAGDLDAMVDELEVSRRGLAQRLRRMGLG